MTTIGFKRPEHDYDNAQQVLNIPKQDFRHTLITGATGSGKTASLILPILKDRILTNNSIIFIEYKGHEHRKIKYLAEQSGRLNDIIELGKPTGEYINIMSLCDINMIKEAIIKMCGGEGKDPYWSTSAAQLATRIIELQRKFQKISNLFIEDFNVKKEFFTLHLSDGVTIRSDYNILNVDEEVCFATLAKIIHTPQSIICYFRSISKITMKIEQVINNLYKKNYTNIEDNKLENLLSEFIIFKNTVDKYANFTIQESNESSGNNGVLQILQNAISSLSAKDYLNKSEVDILTLLNNNAILIIDVQSIDSNIYSILVESLLKKLSGRIKYQIPKEVSIFLDEANRVLTENMDIHNDILRESRVELVLAVQNEEQMQIKFGETVWKSIVSNIEHNYVISSKHKIWYNHSELPKVKPLLFNEQQLDTVEYKYNAMAKNFRYITNRFTFPTTLPSWYKIIYDIHTFFEDSTLELITPNGHTLCIKYVGEDVKIKTKRKIAQYRKMSALTHLSVK